MDFTKPESFYKAVTEVIGDVLVGGRMKELTTLRSEKEYFSFVWSLSKVHSLMRMELTDGGKSDAKALKAKERGNRLYKARDLPQALQEYSRCMIYAAGKHSSCLNLLAIATANRSAVLCEMERYEEALNDIEYAVSQGYPADLAHKLHERRARCLLGLGQKQQAVTSLNQAVSALDDAKMTVDKKQEVAKSLQKEIKKHTLSLESEKENQTEEFGALTSGRKSTSVMTITGSKNAHLPAASSAIRISSSPAKGRYGVAAERINIGDVLMVEEAFAAVVNMDCHGTHCQNCLAALNMPFPCRTCTRVYFCCPTCAQEAHDGYHQAECCLVPYFLSSGAGAIGFLAFRLSIIAGYKAMVHYFETNDGYHLAENEGYSKVTQMVTNACSRSPQEMLQYALLAAFIVKCLEKVDGWFPVKYSAENAITVGSIVLQNLLRIGCNGIEVTEYVTKGQGSGQTSSIGLGLFPTVALLNHSCDPSCELVFSRNKCAVRSMKDLIPGEEVAVDYGFVYYLHPYEKRQEALIAQYKFHCICNACVEKWPIKSAIPNNIITLRCSKCGKVVARDKANITENILCPNLDCLNPIDPKKIIVILEKAEEKTKVNGSLQSGISHLQCYVKLLQRLVAPPNRKYAEALWALRQAYQRLGNVSS